MSRRSPPPLGTLALAYSVGQLGGLIAARVIYGAGAGLATAAVFAYRAFQLGVPAILGPAAFTRLRRTLANSPRPAALPEPMAAACERHTP